MKKNYKKKSFKINFLKDLIISLLDFEFAIIYVIDKILVLLENHLNYFKDSIFEFSFQ